MPKRVKQFVHFGVSAWFSALVHDNTFVVTVGGGVFLEDFLNPIERGGFGDSGGTVQCS